MLAKNKLTLIRKDFISQKLDAIIVSSVNNIAYLTGFSNFSQDEREAFVLITKNKQFILTDGRYTDDVKRKCEDFAVLEISALNSLTKNLKEAAKKYKMQTVGIEEENISFAEYKKLSSCFKYLKNFNLNSYRVVKSIREIQAIQAACAFGDKIFTLILKKLKPGVSEKEIAFEIEYLIKKYAQDISFKPIVAFGKNSSVPHHQTNDQRLKANDIVLLDFGVKLDNYCSDMTRTVFLGKASSEQKKMYHVVLEAQKRAIDHSAFHYNDIYYHSEREQKLLASEVDKAAREYIISQGYPSIPHSLGHGVGLEVHESPRLSPNSKDILKTDMVFSIEPGIYLSHIGGIRIEDLVVLEKNGPRLLTHSPKTLIEL